MTDDMGTFRTDIEIENPARPGERRRLTGVLVDTGAELSWVPAEIPESLGIPRFKLWRFRQADGSMLERWAGPALLYAGGTVTMDEVIFGEVRGPASCQPEPFCWIETFPDSTTESRDRAQ
jgi:hypothetical protein